MNTESAMSLWMKARLHRWALKRVIRVALFGQGIGLSEWQSLDLSPYDKMAHPKIVQINDTAEADLLAVHGPMTPLSWHMFKEWLAPRYQYSKIIVIGAEIDLNGDGHILGPGGELGPKADFVMAGHPPTPLELSQFLKQFSEAPYV